MHLREIFYNCATLFPFNSQRTISAASNQIKMNRFLTSLEYNRTGVITVHESEVDMWIVTAKCLEMIGETSKSLVCGRNRSGKRVAEFREANCSRRWMQQLEMSAYKTDKSISVHMK